MVEDHQCVSTLGRVTHTRSGHWTKIGYLLLFPLPSVKKLIQDLLTSNRCPDCKWQHPDPFISGHNLFGLTHPWRPLQIPDSRRRSSEVTFRLSEVRMMDFCYLGRFRDFLELSSKKRSIRRSTTTLDSLGNFETRPLGLVGVGLRLGTFTILWFIHKIQRFKHK